MTFYYQTYYNLSMNIVNYLTEIYGYDTPIFLKDIRIGRKSKAAVRQELCRATRNGELERKGNGIYFIRSKKEFGSGVTFDDILKNNFIYSKNAPVGFEELFIEGYYSGMTFLNMIGISEQVPAIPEVTTNRTSSKKRFYKVGGSLAIIRKGKIPITFQNYLMLQFLDMFHFASKEDIQKNKELIKTYIKQKHLTKQQFTQLIGLYGQRTMKIIVEGGLFDAFI